ncbi:MAG: sensor histidine kinase [Bacteroidota bacterium]
MEFTKNKDFARWFIVIASLTIVSLISWNVWVFYDRIKEDERSKMLVWTAAMESLNKADDDSNLDLELAIMSSNETIPMINVDEEGKIMETDNIPENILEDEKKLQTYLQKIKNENKPIPIKMVFDDGQEVTHLVYYGNSPVLNKIKYYPFILILLIALFAILIFFFYNTSKSSEQNKLWAGMAKETAHQIGTPLSSLFGWVEILKSEKHIDESYLIEIEKDIDRLKTITERFSKVGSNLKLKKIDLNQATKNSLEYLQSRSSKLIEFSMDLPNEPVLVMLNEPLFSWTIENLTKNAIDAMKGKGKLEIELVRSGKWVRILFTDTGKGIAANKFKKIFEPGYSTKKRGWGLGLSLAKRIVEDYHHGKISVLKSTLNHGTTFEIKLRRMD